METIANCLLCDGYLKLVIDLGMSPVANELFDNIETPIETFPLKLMECLSCKHLQIDTIIDKERLFKNYTFTSNTSQGNLDHFRNYAYHLFNRFQPKKVLDIGSNDGTFLSFIKDNKTTLSVDVQGIEPAKNIAKIANDNGIKTLATFFNEENAIKIANKSGRKDLITCNNCFAHNADLDTIVKGVKELLTDNGVFVLEVAYALPMLQNNRFDLIYFEHIHHWTIDAMHKFFTKHNLVIMDIQEVETHGGSIRVFVKRPQIGQAFSKQLMILLGKERMHLETYKKNFIKNVKSKKGELLAKLKDVDSVSILGYPAKAATVCSYLGLDKTVITDVFDDNKLKVGKYTHQGIKILSTDELLTKNPDALLILAWNYTTELKERFKKYKGKWIVL